MDEDHQWSSHKVRKKFLDFFESKRHAIVSSSPVVLKDDSSLMFTNAGMNQFKDYFLGNAEPKTPRIANTQKCLRVSGKHNDLEEVGCDTHHHTLFEMLGNWSFGEYFKKEAIAWAWELLTVEFKLNRDRLYVTIFEGDENEGLTKDTESYENWKPKIGEDRILNGNKKDNFWDMGTIGPCGASSEVHIDLRSEEERRKIDGKTLVNRAHPQVVEIWNLVFIEFNRKTDGSLEKLSSKHVDTGMGLERLCMALQSKASSYDTDVFIPLIKKIEALSGNIYGEDEKQDIAARVIADHSRAVAFIIADGQLPSNNGAGYVVRRILRRAIRYGFSYLNQKKPFIYHLVDILVEQTNEFFPEIGTQKELVKNVIRQEETSFQRTLKQGLKRLDQIIRNTEGNVVEGARVFELYDTYGFPSDLTALILCENNLSYDCGGYEAAMKQQRERARNATQLDIGDWVELEKDKEEEFIGYDILEAELQITKYRKVTAKKKEQYQLVFNLTPFYPEGGGQIGDTGYIESDKERLNIVDTKKEHSIIIHLVNEPPKNPRDIFKAVVDSAKRIDTAYNHTATHLLHQALREILGAHVEQKGSLVHPDYLRFDFTHFLKMSDEELSKIEKRVNEHIRNNYPLEEYRNIPMQRAVEMGARALFRERYSDTVRVIKFGDSIELCGGTHVQETGQIGLFKILHETSVASGIRRIEAVSGQRALRVNKRMEILNKTLAGMENTFDSSHVKNISKMLAEREKQTWLTEAERKNGNLWIVRQTDLKIGQIKDLLFQIKNERDNVIAIIGTKQHDKAQIAVAFSDKLIKIKGYHAGNIVAEVAKEIQGGGGGQPGFATAGSRNPSGLQKAIRKAKGMIS